MKETLKITILLILLLVLELFAIGRFVSCTNFAGQFHFSAFDLSLRLVENIHNDAGVPLFLVRLFHNKPVGIFFDIFSSYIAFWNVLFLSHFLSLAGVVGLGAGLYSFFTKKKSRILWILFGVLLVVPFVEILGSEKLPYLLRLFLIAGVFLFWSMYGYWYLLKEKKVSSKIIDVLIIVGLWFLWAFQSVLLLCN